MFSIGEFSRIARVTARQLRHYEEIVAAFGVVNWVQNLRVAGEAQFIRGRQIETVRVRELEQVEAAPILKKFLKDFQIVPFIPPYFEATPRSSQADFEKEAVSHPVFEIVSEPSP